MPIDSFTIRGPFQLPSNDLNQAEAEFMARMAHPRNPLWDNPEAIASEYPADIARELYSPFDVGVALGARAVNSRAVAAPLAAHAALSRNVGGNLLERNPVTGEWEMKFSGHKKQELDERTKNRVDVLKSAIKKTQAQYLKAPDEVSKGELARTLNGFNQQLEQLLAKKEEVPTSPWLVDPMTIPSGGSIQYPKTSTEANALSMFGQPGERTPFAFSGGSAPPPVAPPRRRRYNPQTGDFEP